MKKLAPIHPGEVLREEFLAPMNVSQYRLARSIAVPARRINGIVQEKRAISADTALRLARFFGTSPEFWTILQAHFDLEAQKMKLGDRVTEMMTYPAVATRMRQTGDAPVRATARHARSARRPSRIGTFSKRSAKHR